MTTTISIIDFRASPGMAMALLSPVFLIIPSSNCDLEKSFSVEKPNANTSFIQAQSTSSTIIVLVGSLIVL